jgi:hypothetical protein
MELLKRVVAGHLPLPATLRQGSQNETTLACLSQACHVDFPTEEKAGHACSIGTRYRMPFVDMVCASANQAPRERS